MTRAEAQIHAHSQPPSRLARRLGTFDAVVIGLASMLGAGVFVVFGPAARAAGNALLLGLALAALVAYCNATSTAALAAVYSESGGAYVYGRKQLGHAWGFVAGWGFVIGKLASCAAMALTFASYAAPSLERPVGVAAVLGVTIIAHFGVQKSALVTRVIVLIVLLALGLVVASVWFGSAADPRRIWPLEGATLPGVLEASGLLFFAFAGYARVATLGEEVIEPKSTIPRAISVALGITLCVYAAVALSALAGAGAPALALSRTPLATAVEASGLVWALPFVRVGAAVASLGVLLSLMTGVGRTLFALGANRDLPVFLAAIHPRSRVPHRAGLVVGALVATVVLLADVRGAIGFSSFAVLCYYAIANAAAWTLDGEGALRRRVVAAVGFGGCLLLAVCLPRASVVAGAALMLSGGLIHAFLRRRSGAEPPRG